MAQPLQDGEPQQWGASLSAFPDPSGHGWSLAVGRSAGGAFPACSRLGSLIMSLPLALMSRTHILPVTLMYDTQPRQPVCLTVTLMHDT